jgi:hypothetical protein
MEKPNATKPTLAQRAAREAIDIAVIALYLFICFASLLYLKASILAQYAIPFAPLGLAAVKALVCAKFVSIGKLLRLGERGLKSRPLIWQTLYRSAIFLILLLVLNALEEVIVGLLHHRTAAASLAEFGGGTLNQLAASSLVCFLVLVPFFAFRALGEAVGENNLVTAFFGTFRKA